VWRGSGLLPQGYRAAGAGCAWVPVWCAPSAVPASSAAGLAGRAPGPRPGAVSRRGRRRPRSCGGQG